MSGPVSREEDGEIARMRDLRVKPHVFVKSDDHRPAVDQKCAVCGEPYSNRIVHVVAEPVSMPFSTHPDPAVRAMAPERAGREGDSQPMPHASTHPIAHEMVKADLDARLALGIKRYGQPLRAFNGRNSLRDAYEEALDLCVYLATALYEQEHPQHVDPAPGPDEAFPDSMIRDQLGRPIKDVGN